MSLLLFCTFLCLSLGIIFSLASKIIWLYFGGEDITPDTDLYWIKSQIMGFRFSLGAIIIGAIFSYIQKEKLFQEERNKNKDILSMVIGAICFLICIILPRDLDIIAFAAAFVYIAYVYLPFAVQTARVSRTLEKGTYQSAFKYLTVMAISFMLIFLCFLLDKVINSILRAQTGVIHGYSVFYYLGWALALGGMWSAYLGYIRPGGENREG